MPSPVLPGITRGAIEELASGDGIGCSKRMLAMDDLLDSDEMFMTNSSWGVLPIIGVEAASIGDAHVGPVTTRLRELLHEDMARED
jgi:branched-subunit amino acid aminotransferase/4-amino-4-deoxychorismate lyase